MQVELMYQPAFTLGRIDELLVAACQRLRPYLAHNPDISDADRALCPSYLLPT